MLDQKMQDIADSQYLRDSKINLQVTDKEK